MNTTRLHGGTFENLSQLQARILIFILDWYEKNEEFVVTCLVYQQNEYHAC